MVLKVYLDKFFTVRVEKEKQESDETVKDNILI